MSNFTFTMFLIFGVLASMLLVVGANTTPQQAPEQISAQPITADR